MAPDNTVLEGWIAPCGGAYSTTDDLMSLAKFVFNDNQTYFEKDTLNEWYKGGRAVRMAAMIQGCAGAS